MGEKGVDVGGSEALLLQLTNLESELRWDCPRLARRHPDLPRLAGPEVGEQGEDVTFRVRMKRDGMLGRQQQSSAESHLRSQLPLDAQKSHIAALHIFQLPTFISPPTTFSPQRIRVRQTLIVPQNNSLVTLDISKRARNASQSILN